MTPLNKRFALFLLGCIPVRLSFVVLARTLPIQYIKLAAIPALLLATAFFIIFFFKLRKSGPETMGAPIWWNALRPVHGIIWASIAYFAFKENREVVWRLLLFDVIFGLVSFTIHHSVNPSYGGQYYSM